MPREVKAPHEDKGLRGVNGVNTEKKRPNGFMHALSLLSHFAVTIIACIAVGLLLGTLLDNLLGTTPWLLLVFTLLGIAAAFKSIFDIAKKL